MVTPLERHLEEHFCEELEKPFKGKESTMAFVKRSTAEIDLETLIDDELLVRFLQKTQMDELKELKIDLKEDWLPAFKKEIYKKLNLNGKPLEKRMIFEIIREGVEVHGRRFKLVYFKPAKSYNRAQGENYKSNIFSYVRQFAFRKTMESIDVVLFLNGIAVVTIELKSKENGQNVHDAISQYIGRDKSLKIFQVPLLHLAVDNEETMMATQFVQNAAEDFNPFNKDIKNTDPLAKDDFLIDYLYHDVFRPESLLEIIEAYLFCYEEKDKQGNRFRRFFFPRYHQRKTVATILNDLVVHYKKNQELNLKYLIQHSAGSGKSYTIAVMQKFLRYAHVDNQPIFDSIIVVTDRLNLDRQINGTIDSSESQPDIILHAETTSELADALNKNTSVVISTIQKFSVPNLDKIMQSQKGKRICFIIDEAHRSQAGKLHRHMVEKFDDADSVQEEILTGISKRNYPNAVFIALTATPSEKTQQMFGKPFPGTTYTMEQAEQERYILDVSENIVSYETYYKLSHDLEETDEYPLLVIVKKLKDKAYSDDKVIQGKIDLILEIFNKNTKNKIDGTAKAMIVASSRLAAVKYKIFMDKVIKAKNLPYKTLVAFSGTKVYENNSYTEVNMNNIDEHIEDEFKKNEYRFIIVANKFQYGFNQPRLHTMFLDKSVNGINAVQTISRLNRVMRDKTDTLVVDFTGSYKAILSAFSKYKKVKNDFSDVDVHSLPKLKQDILIQNHFSKQDVDDYWTAATQSLNPAATDAVMRRVKRNIDKLSILEVREIKTLLNKFNDLFAYLNNLVRITDDDMNHFAFFTYRLSKYIDPIGKGVRLEQELAKVQVTRYAIKEKPILEVKEPKASYGQKPPRAPIYATVEEVVEAVNANCEIALDTNEKSVLQRYVQQISDDPDIISSIKANKSYGMDKLFTVHAAKLTEKAIDFFMANDIMNLNAYFDKGVIGYLNREGFRLAATKV